MVSVSGKSLLSMTLMVIAVMAVSSFAAVSVSEDSEAAPVTEWYSYGHHLEFRDRSYSPATYSNISWTYSSDPLSASNPGTTVSGDPSDGYSFQLDLDPAEYPIWVVKPLFVRETAQMASGQERTTEFIVNVNPIPDVCYVLFMYDDTHGYKYQPVSRTTSIAVGTDPLVELPLEPSRSGYTFGGWYRDAACTTPFNNMDPQPFSSDSTINVYPKWIATGSPVEPGSETHFIMLQAVDGLNMEYDGMAVARGSSFSFTVSVMDCFRFDLTGLYAVTGTGQKLTGTVNPDGSHTFTIGSVSSDTTVMLTGYKQYFKVLVSLDNVSTVGYEAWALQGSTLSLPLTSTVGGDVRATVYMAGIDVTGNSFHDGRVVISSVQGDVMIFADSVEKPATSDGFPWEYVAIAAIVIAVLLAVMLVRRSRL